MCVKVIDLIMMFNVIQIQVEGMSDVIWGSGVLMVLVGIMMVVFVVMFVQVGLVQLEFWY